MRWNYTPVDAAETAALARSLTTAPIVAELLLRNALNSPEAAARFLAPALASLGDPFLLSNLTEAVERLLLARRLQQSIVGLGDYDVDGAISCRGEPPKVTASRAPRSIERWP